MKLNNTKRLWDGVVNGAESATFDIDINEANELRKALALVYNYQKAAFKACKFKAKDADWYNIQYCVKNDKVIVTIESGACG
jgi:hypothetical protein